MTMPQPAWSRLTLSLVSAGLLLPLAGCKFIAARIAQQANNDPKVRQKIVEGAQSSCLKSSHDAFPQIPNREAIIVNYCKCFSERGLATFSNAEVAEIGLRPGNQLTAEENKKLNGAVDMCVAEAKNKVTAPAP